jgi:hypothetical protein
VANVRALKGGWGEWVRGKNRVETGSAAHQM